jgi:nucleoid-associated protein EbfC
MIDQAGPIRQARRQGGTMGQTEPTRAQAAWQRIHAVRQQIISAKEALVRAEVNGTAGAGMVTVTLRGNGEVTRIAIDPNVVDPDDVATLESLLLAAFRNATDAMRMLTEETMSPVTTRMGDMAKELRVTRQ